jgi:type I restriction enzyme M protein
LDAVIGLPKNLFFGTGIPAVILIFKKQRKDESVFFIDASMHFGKGTNQNYLREEDIKNIVNEYSSRIGTPKFSELVTREAIAQNNYNLNITAFVDTFEEDIEIDILNTHEKICKLNNDLNQIEKNLEGYLKELGYGI